MRSNMQAEPLARTSVLSYASCSASFSARKNKILLIGVAESQTLRNNGSAWKRNGFKRPLVTLACLEPPLPRHHHTARPDDGSQDHKGRRQQEGHLIFAAVNRLMVLLLLGRKLLRTNVGLTTSWHSAKNLSCLRRMAKGMDGREMEAVCGC
jgi:hypothetical protein